MEHRAVWMQRVVRAAGAAHCQDQARQGAMRGESPRLVYQGLRPTRTASDSLSSISV